MAQAQTEPKRALMPNNLLKAAIEGNETDLKQLLGLNDEEQDHPPHTKVSIEDVTPMEPSDCLIRSAAGMENTILHILSANDHENLVSAICMKDSSLLKACNVRNETPFHHAARYGHVNTILRLMENAKLEFGEAELKELLRQKNCLGETALHEAARHGHGDVVLTLMEANPELAGLVNDDFVSPLYLATARGSLDMVENMVEKMLDQEITPAFYSGLKKQTALHAAVLQDQEFTIALLKLYSEPLGKGADETGRTPLHFVASTGNHNIAKLLLDKDQSLAYIQDSDGSFPVHTAVRMGHFEIIVLLLQRCLDSGDLLDGNGRNFLHVAIEAKKSKVILKLLKVPKKLLPISHWKKMFSRMVNKMDNKGNTPSHLAAEHGDIDLMCSLLKNNELDLTLQNKEGLTAFDISEIQLGESARKTKGSDIVPKFHRRACSSTGWFQYYTKVQMSETESTIGIMYKILGISTFRSTIQEHISTTDSTGAKKSSERVMAKAQLVGLGSVLIATVTFAAPFTLPGGTNQDGTPILGRKYFFKAFVLADFSAFVLSFLSTMVLIYSSSDENSDRMEMHVAKSITLFTYAAKCMVIALALGLYMVLAPVSQTTARVVYASSWYFINWTSPDATWQYYRRYKFRSELQKHILDGASRLKTLLAPFKMLLFIIYQIYLPIYIPLIIMYVCALF